MTKKVKYQHLIYWIRKNKANRDQLLRHIEVTYQVILTADNLETFIKVMFEADTCESVFDDLVNAAGIEEKAIIDSLL